MRSMLVAFSLIAAMTKAPVIPAAIVGTEKIFSREVKFPRLAVVYGKPLNFTGNAKDKNDLEEFARSIMSAIAELRERGNREVSNALKEGVNNE